MAAAYIVRMYSDELVLKQPSSLISRMAGRDNTLADPCRLSVHPIYTHLLLTYQPYVTKLRFVGETIRNMLHNNTQVSNRVWRRSSRVVRPSGCQCQSHNSPEFHPSIFQHSGIWGAADEAVLNNIQHKRKHPKNPPFTIHRGLSWSGFPVLKISLWRCCPLEPWPPTEKKTAENAPLI